MKERLKKGKHLKVKDDTEIHLKVKDDTEIHLKVDDDTEKCT
jgi:hypothetical protein